MAERALSMWCRDGFGEYETLAGSPPFEDRVKLDQGSTPDSSPARSAVR